MMQKIAVLSGKGGVGKSTIAWNLALSLKDLGFKVGVLDSDIHCPNLPQIAGIDPVPELLFDLEETRIIPCVHKGIEVISLAFTIPLNAPVLWKGARKKEAVEQLINLTNWNNLDYLIVDCPAGTGEELMAALSGNIAGALVVTTPHAAATADAGRAIAALQEYQTKLIGIIVNMAEIRLNCPSCGHSICFEFPFDNFVDKELIIAEIPHLDGIRKSNIIPDFKATTGIILKRLDCLKDVKVKDFYSGLRTKFIRKIAKKGLDMIT